MCAMLNLKGINARNNNCTISSPGKSNGTRKGDFPKIKVFISSVISLINGNATMQNLSTFLAGKALTLI